MGDAPQWLLVRVLLRPAIYALISLLLLIFAVRQTTLWPYGLATTLSIVALWDGYAGTYLMLRLRPGGRAGFQLQACAIWLVNTVVNLTLLNTAAQLAFPGTWEWRGGPASVLDVAYLTLLTFASSSYGDVLPATAAGKALSMLTSLAGLVYATLFVTAIWQMFAPPRSID
ncbi:MAG TPA: ion channel [Symbiobacteriaceae bacterium]|nr:ion channel [Symbiobacteriaceae bacterium]